MASTHPTATTADLEFATFHEGYLSRYIQLADAKAGTLLVVVAAVLGYLLGQDRVVDAILLETTRFRSALAFATIAALGASGVMCFLVVAPRQGSPGDSLIFWNDVARRTEDEFIDLVRQAGPEEIARQRLAHSHALTRVCRAKYRWLGRALPTGAVGALGALACRLAF